MDGAISILSFDECASSAALVGRFTGDNTDFLVQHLDELTGDVVLECEHLEALDESTASILLDFRNSADRQGRRVIFRGVPPECRSVLVSQATLEPRCVR